MIIYRTKIETRKSKSELEMTLRKRIVSKEQEGNIYIFPFSLFTKSFHEDKAIFEGTIENNKFKLGIRSKHIATQSRLPIFIEGAINNDSIDVKFRIPNLVISIILILIILGLVTVTLEKHISQVLFLISGLFFARYFFLILRILNTLKKICR